MMSKGLLIVDDESKPLRAPEAEKEDHRFHDEVLTAAENRIAASVARGLSNKEIAAEMQISVRTVENHVSHILDKKHFNNRVEIARHVFETNDGRRSLNFEMEPI